MAKESICSFNKQCLTMCFSGGLLTKRLLGKIYSIKLFICLNNSTNIYSAFVHDFQCASSSHMLLNYYKTILGKCYFSHLF